MSTPINLITKLREVTAEITSVEARGRNDFLRTNYVLEDDVINAVRTKLTDRNVVMLPSLVKTTDRAAKTAKDKDTTITDVTIDWTFYDGDSDQTLTLRWAGRGEDPTDKGLAMAETSALRTLLLKAFLVPKSGDEKAPAAPPRSDGQKALSDEQYDGILEAWTAIGKDAEVLAGILDAKKIATVIEGHDLTLGQRVRLLSALEAIDVQKSLMALKPEPVPA